MKGKTVKLGGEFAEKSFYEEVAHTYVTVIRYDEDDNIGTELLVEENGFDWWVNLQDVLEIVK